MKKEKHSASKLKQKHLQCSKVKSELFLYSRLPQIDIDTVKLMNLIINKKYLNVQIDAYFHRKIDDIIADVYRHKQLNYLTSDEEAIYKYKNFTQIKKQIKFVIDSSVKQEYIFSSCFDSQNYEVLNRYFLDKRNLQKKKYCQFDKGKNSMVTPSTFTTPSKTFQPKYQKERVTQKSQNDSNYQIARLANNIDKMINCRQRKGIYAGEDSFQIQNEKKKLFFPKGLSQIKKVNSQCGFAANLSKKIEHLINNKPKSKSKDIKGIKRTLQQESYGLKSFRKPKTKPKYTSKDKDIKNQLKLQMMFNNFQKQSQPDEDYQVNLFCKTPQPHMLNKGNYRNTMKQQKKGVKSKHFANSQRTSVKGSCHFSKSPTPQYRSPRQSIECRSPRQEIYNRKKIKSDSKNSQLNSKNTLQRFKIKKEK